MSELTTSNVPSTGVPSNSTARKSLFQILLAYDGSAESQAAVDLVQERFKPGAGLQAYRLTAMTVLPTQQFGSHENLQKSLDDLAQKMEAQGMPVETILKSGNPAVTIIAHSEENGADLIVMGAKGMHATLGILLGGVAQSVVENANVPVLIVKAPYRGLRRVLVVLDGSQHSRKAIQYLAPICSEDPQAADPRIHGQPIHSRQPATHLRCSWLPADGQITLLHVMQPEIPPEVAIRAWTLGPEVLYPAPISPMDIAELQRQEIKTGQEILADAQLILKEAGMNSETLLRRGDAAGEILNIARQNDTDLIVCGSRGLNPVSGWLLGSVSRKLVHYSPCSVLIVK